MTNGPLPFWKERAFRCILTRSFLAFTLLGIVVVGIDSFGRHGDVTAWLELMAIFALYAAVLGLFIAVPAGALWFVLRPLRGEPLPSCAFFGLLPGLILGLLFNDPFHEPQAVLSCMALGALGGLLFWLMGKLSALLGVRYDV